MKKVIFLIVACICSVKSYAIDTYQCQYSKADVSDGKLGQMSYPTPAKVEVVGASIKAYRPDGSFIFSPPLNKKNESAMMADDGGTVYAAADDRGSFAVSDRIKKTTEQWDKCNSDTTEKNKTKSEEEMTFIETMNSSQAKKYFLREKHAFTTNCTAWDDVTMITGKFPAMIIAGQVSMAKNPKWSQGEYSFVFNNGSMIARFTPSKKDHKLLIQAGDNFYGCGPTIIDRRF